MSERRGSQGTIPACGAGDPGGGNSLAVGSTSRRSIALTFRVFRACFLRELFRLDGLAPAASLPLNLLR